MIVLSVASGTSADGLDVGLVDLSLDDGVVEAEVLSTSAAPWPHGVREQALAVLPPAATTARDLALLDAAVGQAVAAVARAACEDAPVRPDLVVSPGQTVHHEVVGERCLTTLQLGQPAWVAEATGLPVVSDLRTANVAAGGHGAPLAVVLDALWLAGSDVRAALNLGGIANITVVGPTGAAARDTGPANCLLDVVAERVTGEPFDRDGALAARGRVDDDLLARLLRHPHLQPGAGTSTGREVFSAAWLDEQLDGQPWPDVQATLVELTAATVADAVLPASPVEVVASGGGTANPVLMGALQRRLGAVPLVRSEAHGLPADGKEAVLWCLLGFLSWHGVPVSTGAHAARVAGRFSPGRHGLVLPPSTTGTPSRLRLRR